MSLNIEKSRAQLRLPLLVVFDLDSCLWTPEMFELRGSPTEPVKGELLQAGEGNSKIVFTTYEDDNFEAFPA